MSQPAIDYRLTRDIQPAQIASLYEANAWSSAKKPGLLHKALVNSHTLVSAWDGETLVGIGNAISDGHLVVYYPHLLVLPGYHGQGIGREILRRLMAPYDGFHQHMLVADAAAADFYVKAGFARAGKTIPMWIYAGEDH